MFMCQIRCYRSDENKSYVNFASTFNKVEYKILKKYII